jgi:hypothetical protein
MNRSAFTPRSTGKRVTTTLHVSTVANDVTLRYFVYQFPQRRPSTVDAGNPRSSMIELR